MISLRQAVRKDLRRQLQTPPSVVLHRHFATADVVLLALGAKVIERFGTGGVRRWSGLVFLAPGGQLDGLLPRLSGALNYRHHWQPPMPPWPISLLSLAKILLGLLFWGARVFFLTFTPKQTYLGLRRILNMQDHNRETCSIALSIAEGTSSSSVPSSSSPFDSAAGGIHRNSKRSTTTIATTQRGWGV